MSSHHVSHQNTSDSTFRNCCHDQVISRHRCFFSQRPYMRAAFLRQAHQNLSLGCKRHCAKRHQTSQRLRASQDPNTTEPQAPAPTKRKRILSGVQPTGSLHLGNYLGAIRNWVTLQDLYDTYFCVVDLHAITLPHEPKDLMAASKSCATPIGWLRRMTQFKEKSKNQGEEVGTGLLTYPVLMAADILLYQDQMAHIELTRDIAERVNKLYGGNKWKKLGGRGGRIFRIPEGFIPPTGARVMSLTDGRKKMSKSDESDLSRINLLDDPKTITSKVKKAKTDAFEGLEDDNPERPEARNLLAIYQLMTGYSRASIMEEMSGLNWGSFKPKVAEAIIAHLEPIQAKYAEVMADPAILDNILEEGADIANQVALQTLENCRQAMGFTPRFIYDSD